MAIPSVLMPEVDFIRDPLPDFHERLAHLRKIGPVVSVKAFGEPAWLLTNHAVVKAAFLNYDAFNSSQYHKVVASKFKGRGIQAMDGAEHRSHRALFSPSFSASRVRGHIEALIEPIVHELLDRIEGNELVNIKEEFCRPFPFRVITKLLGVPVDDEARLIELANSMVNYIYDPEQSLAANRAFDTFILPLLDDRRSNPREDLLTLLVQMIDDQRLDAESGLAFLHEIYPAGGHSTALNMATAVYCALANPAARSALAGTEKEQLNVAYEALRWEPAFGLIPRLTTNNVQIHGSDIRQGDRAILAIAAANSDPAVFYDPRTFDPTRKNLNEILTFGRNAHFCLGSNLAPREISVGLRLLFQRFPDLSLAEDHAVTFGGSVFRSCKALWVRPYGARSA